MVREWSWDMYCITIFQCILYVYIYISLACPCWHVVPQPIFGDDLSTRLENAANSTHAAATPDSQMETWTQHLVCTHHTMPCNTHRLCQTFHWHLVSHRHAIWDRSMAIVYCLNVTKATKFKQTAVKTLKAIVFSADNSNRDSGVVAWFQLVWRLTRRFLLKFAESIVYNWSLQIRMFSIFCGMTTVGFAQHAAQLWNVHVVWTQ